MGGRLPDFLVIGAMKAATTSVFRWLEEHPGTAMPAAKEPAFFSNDDRWSRGVDWYRGLFPATGGPTGEASVRYTDPRRAAVSATRIAQVLPSARLVFVARDPAARARSHYVHEVRHARESRPFAAALAADDSPYAERSRYYQCLLPYLDGPLAENLLVVSFESLVGPDPATWGQVLAHLGLDPISRPSSATNVGARQPQYTRAMRTIKDRGLHRHIPRLPAPLRRIGRRALVRDASATDPLVLSAQAPIPERVQRAWRADAGSLAASVGLREPSWRL